MKLVLIIVANEDATKVSNALIKEKFYVTKLATTGGLLSSGNTTLLVGTDDEKVQKVVSVVGEVAKSRKQQVNPKSDEVFSMLSSFPFEVNVNGATIFVLEVAGHYKL